MNATAPNPAGEDFDKLAPFTEAMGEVRTIVEVGCHRMQDTARMLKQWPDAKIICLEPDPRALAFIKRHGVLERLRGRDGFTVPHLSPFAAGAHRGMGMLKLSTNFSDDPDKEWEQSSSLRLPNQFGNREDLGDNPCVFDGYSYIVQIFPLDEHYLIQSWSIVDLLWIDSQGFEDEVLKGATETLKRTRFIFMEHNTDGVYENAPCLADLLALLPGWEVIATLPYDVLLKNKGDYPLTPSK